MTLKRLPVGIENFEEIRKRGFYYVDKTRLIEKLLENWSEANLFTRPRRFGKSLNMSMLRNFFEIGGDKHIFDGLYIAENQKLCEEYMGQFPVISVSLKGIEALDYPVARSMAVAVLGEAAKRFQFLLDSPNLTAIDKNDYMKLVQDDMSDQTLRMGLKELSRLLYKHYGKKVIVLIDEYDVPLAKANEHGYYEPMVELIRGMFGNVLKTNEYLMFSVLTGCLRVAKESIFTGLNNFNVFSITDVDFDEYFGFTEPEVCALLEYYGQQDQYDTIQEWYDGYRFGNVDVYCPWDVINYCDRHRRDPQLEPQNYWMNTSGNDVIRHFITQAGEKNQLTQAQLERLISGASVQKEVRQELTYKDLYDSSENIWSTLFMTGYLTQRGKLSGDRYELVIPNHEIRNIMTEQILTLFKERVKEDGMMLQEFCDALQEGRAADVQRLFTEYMKKTISVRDTFVRKPVKENFYHGMLLGILGFKEGWYVRSNREAGDGFSDIMIQMDDSDVGIMIEVKYAEESQLESACQKAVEQMKVKNYAECMYAEDIHTILKYGIACNRKKCCVLLEKET